MKEFKLLPGEKAFYLVDTEGFPFELLMLELKDRGVQLDIIGFMRVAMASRNFSKKRLKAMMITGTPITSDLFDFYFEHIMNTPLPSNNKMNCGNL